MSQTSNGTIRRRVLYGVFFIVLVPVAPLAGRAAGTVWGAIDAYHTTMALFHNKHIALRITGQVFKDAYRTYLHGR